MGKDNGWQRLGELSKILQTFRHMYLHQHAEGDHPALGHWRRQLRQFLKVNEAFAGTPVQICPKPARGYTAVAMTV